MLLGDYKIFRLSELDLTKYLFFTGKGGVGKTSISCGTALGLADNGKKVLLISTDSASNLQDVFNTTIDNKGVRIKESPNLVVLNVDPIEAANEYKESVVGPFRGVLPEDVVENMEEQLSGSCTVEIAAFNEFSKLITDKAINEAYDYIIFDTAPTGHTLRMLELPSAWTNFINENTTGASCLGQLSGLGDKKEMYADAVKVIADSKKTTLLLVARPEESPIMEASRTSKELVDLGIENQVLIINGIMDKVDDEVSKSMRALQDKIINNIPRNLKDLKGYYLPLKSFNITGVESARDLFNDEDEVEVIDYSADISANNLDYLIDDLNEKNKKVIFVMGKGGVGKTTIASEIATGLVERGRRVHLTTTDPANHLNFYVKEIENLSISHIDEKKEVENYRDYVLDKSRAVLSEDDLAYIEEDLRSPCTQEIAVFRAFADVVEKADDEIVIIDTAPTGHTLLLLNTTENYSKEISRSTVEVPESVKRLLPRLRNEAETEVVIVTLPEPTPVFEAKRLKEDLERAGIANNWWIVNQSLQGLNIKNSILKVRAKLELEWIDEVKNISRNNFAIIPWRS